MADKPIARVGDVHVCPAHGTNAIVTSAGSMMVNDRFVAQVGDKTTCGAEILTGAPSFFGQGSLVAYLGSTTSHGGLITTGSPDTFVGVETVAVRSAGFNAASEDALINDPPLESVPILPIEAAIQATAEMIETVKTEGISFGAVGSALLSTLTRGIGNKLPIEEAVQKVLKHSRSSSEALGKAGMEQAKKKLALKTDNKYTDRYHGPDDLARDKTGKLTEIEAKGNNRNSTAVAKNKSKERQSSKAKNKRRAEQMVDKKSKKIDVPSNRQGGAYTQEEINLWDEIKNRDGNKRHLSVHTNTETGRVRVLERNAKGKNPKILDDFKMDDFDEIKQGIEEAFKK